MNDSLKNRIEVAANICIVLIALILCVTFLPRLWVFKHDQMPMKMLLPGMQVSLPKYDWAVSDRNLLLVLSVGCRFCSESADFYKRLAAERGNSSRVRLAGVFPQDRKAASKYLQELGLSVDTVLQMPLSSMGVAATPTLILADNRGLVKKLWMGQLSTQRETEVLKEVR
jgi:hypothetical protein